MAVEVEASATSATTTTTTIQTEDATIGGGQGRAPRATVMTRSGGILTTAAAACTTGRPALKIRLRLRLRLRIGCLPSRRRRRRCFPRTPTWMEEETRVQEGLGEEEVREEMGAEEEEEGEEEGRDILTWAARPRRRRRRWLSLRLSLNFLSPRFSNGCEATTTTASTEAVAAAAR